MQINRGLIHAIGLAVAGLVTAGGAAHAQLLTADVSLNPTFEQTESDVTPTGGFFSGRAFFTNTTDFGAGTLTYGGPGSPAALTLAPPRPRSPWADQTRPSVGYRAIFLPAIIHSIS
jgi:hypothetical protein